MRLWQSCFLLHGVEGCENDILIPSDKHHLCEQMRRHDGVLLGSARTYQESKGKVAYNAKWREVLALLNRHELSACHRSEVNREMSLKVLNVSKVCATMNFDHPYPDQISQSKSGEATD